MREPRDECRDVELASGETIRVRGRGGLGPAGVAALSGLVEAVRAKAAETPPDPGAPQLWARIEAALDPDSAIPLREAAKAAGVRFSVLFRVRQGRMPNPADLGAIETWLETYSADSSPEPTPGTGDS